ncbi:MAG: Triosephosphate isomerase [Candidatus Anoxychlamydiales bacterium]|nr:Triosephosphate isomerase [Candidatus Anoxychlamydiales bacterium]NGX40787.1 Triosephosphate isomerase [Candidatus Anoxychlamydiales bacterium]HEU64328.1 triose-phosphate isomerase [Chlamydiota bacterium]
MDKKSIVAGNWKMNKTNQEAKEFIKNLAPLIQSARASVYISPSFTALQESIAAANNTNIIIGAQNMHDETDGAFTGEISGGMLKALGVEFVILGHSERRHIFQEDSIFINRKLIRALKDGLQPILCIGETQKEREEKKTESVLEEQFLKGIQNISKKDASNIIIAYEPVWAIGTGKTATSEIAEHVHTCIRKLIVKHFDSEISKNMHVLYGGSVKPQNVEELMQQENIDGVLVGGASLDYKIFAEIINKA